VALVVDRIDERRSAHRVVVIFHGLHVPPFGSLWVDAFRPDELVLVAELNTRGTTPRSQAFG
jgi:hypothetical protein